VLSFPFNLSNEKFALAGSQGFQDRSLRPPRFADLIAAECEAPDAALGKYQACDFDRAGKSRIALGNELFRQSE
jgi:hypothetical protein